MRACAPGLRLVYMCACACTRALGLVHMDVDRRIFVWLGCPACMQGGGRKGKGCICRVRVCVCLWGAWVFVRCLCCVCACPQNALDVNMDCFGHGGPASWNAIDTRHVTRVGASCCRPGSSRHAVWGSSTASHLDMSCGGVWRTVSGVCAGSTPSSSCLFLALLPCGRPLAPWPTPCP